MAPSALLVGLDRSARVIFTALAFLSFFLGGALLSWVVLPIAGLGIADGEERARRSRRIVSRAFVLFHDYMRVFRLIDFDPRGVELPRDLGPCVVVANHPTLVDVTAVLSAMPEAVCIVKGPLFRNPGVGPLLRMCRHIVSERDDGFAGTSVVRATIAALEKGVPVLIFPEGTRSPENGMHRWRRGAFEVAARAHCPVLPIRITCHPPMLAKSAPWYRVHREVPVMRLEVLEMADPADWAGDSARMAADIERRVRACGAAPQREDAVLRDEENPANAGPAVVRMSRRGSAGAGH